MVRSEDALAPGEFVQKRLHRHWKVMIRPVAWIVAAFAVILIGVVILPPALMSYVILVLIFGLMFVPLTVWPFLVWRNTRFVFTNERVLLVEGVIKLERRDILLTQVNDVKFKQTALDRVLGSGTLTVQFSDRKDPTHLTDIPSIVEVHGQVVRQLVGAGKQQQARDEKIREALSNFIRQSGGPDIAPSPPES